MAIAKGLGGGYAPIGALLMQKSVRDHRRGLGRVPAQPHLHGASPRLRSGLGGAAGDAPRRSAGECRGAGRVSGARLKERLGNHPFVGDVRGRGLFQPELVADRGTKEPFDPKLKLNARLKHEAMARGLMVYPMGGTVDGVRGDHVLLAPPFIVWTPPWWTPSSNGSVRRSMP